jgi:hypothetical protein
MISKNSNPSSIYFYTEPVLPTFKNTTECNKISGCLLAESSLSEGMKRKHLFSQASSIQIESLSPAG